MSNNDTKLFESCIEALRTTRTVTKQTVLPDDFMPIIEIHVNEKCLLFVLQGTVKAIDIIKPTTEYDYVILQAVVTVSNVNHVYLYAKNKVTADKKVIKHIYRKVRCLNFLCHSLEPVT